MGVSKVTLNGATLMDVTDKTVDTDNLLNGETALRNDGESISGAVVTAAASDTAPAMDGTASAGSATTYSRGDHVHPSDTSKQAVITATGILKGNGAGSVTAATIDDTPTNNSTNLVTSGGVFSAIPTKTSDLTNDSSFITASGAPVQSVNSKTGAVVLTASDVGALPDDTTIPQGTVTSVRVQATNPVQSSTSTAQSATLNTTISLANGYGDTQNPYASKTKNTVLAAPSTANGTPSFRALVADDIPSLTISKISDFPEIPSKTSDLTNDSNFVSDASYVHTDNNFTTTLKNRLEGIAAGAEVNQNAFSNVKVGNSTIAADTKTDTLTLTAGGNITLTPDTTNDAVTIAAIVPTKVSELTNDSSYITAAGAPVQSVNSKTGAVTLTAADVGALPDSTTIPQGTVTSVRVQATSPVQSSTSTAQSATLNTTISLANGYGDTKNPYAAKNANVVLAGPSTGEASVPSFRALVADDIPSLTKSKISDFPESMPPDAHTHGDITNGGDIATNATIASGDRLVINDESASKITNSSITFGTSTTTFLSNKGTWATPTGAVTSVNSKSGAVTLTASDVSALPDTTDVTKWNGVELSKTVSDLSNQEAIVPFLWSSSETTARYAKVSKVPSYNCIAQYSNGYLNSTTPSASDNSTKVATTEYVDSAISNLGSILNYKGTKATESALPSTGNVTGDVWIVSADNSEYVWNGTAWEKLGPTIDLSGYVPTSRTVNGKALSADISLSASDVSALPDSTDVTKWAGIALNTGTTLAGNSLNIPVFNSTYTSAGVTTATTTPTGQHIPLYDGSKYLYSTTPAASDNSKKVATTAYVKTAVGSISVPVTSVNSKTGAVVLTAADVGALPTTTSIPSATSDLTNDSGFITSADIPAYTFNNGVSVATNGVDIYNSGVVSVGASPSTAANGTIAVTTGTGKTTSSTSYIAVKGLGTAAYTASTAYAAASHEQALSTITGADDLKAIEALTGTSGFLKKTAANTWSLDTASYVPTTRTVNGKALSSNISLSASDVGALPDTSDIPSASSTTPIVDGTATTGVESSWARGDHVHPTDTTRQAKITASGILKGDGTGGVTAAIAGTDYSVGDEVFTITLTYNNALVADKTYAQIQTAIDAGQELILKKGEYTGRLHYYVANAGAVFTTGGYTGAGPTQVIWSVDPQDTWTESVSQATCASIGALPLSGGTMTGQLTTSFGAVAMGTLDGGNCTLPELAQRLRYSSGAGGSFYLNTAYEINQWGVNIPVSWYNFLWIPHRSGGNSGQASGDNCDYGTLFLSDMTGNSGAYSVRFTNGAIANVVRLDNVDAGSWTQPTYTYRGVNYAIDWTIGNGTTGAVDANGITGNYCGYYGANGPSTAIGATTGDGALWTQAYSSAWMCQIAGDYRNGNLFVRGKNNGTFTAWKKLGANTTITVSLPVASWNTSTKQISVSASGVTASNLVEVSPAPASWSVASAAGVYCSAQAANSLTFKCSSIPTAAITVNVVIWG